MVFLLGLAAYDWTYGAFPTPLQHIAYMISANKDIGVPDPLAVHPVQWFSGFYPTPYYLKTRTTNNQITSLPVKYLGQPNMVVLLLIWLALPAAIANALKKNPLDLFSTLWLGIVYFTFVAFTLIRLPYAHYMLLLTPALCMINARFLARLPRYIILTYCLGVLLWFIVWFPVNWFA